MEEVNEIDNILVKLKIYPNVKGYEYIKYAILNFDKKSFVCSMTKYVYPLIAKDCNATPSKVERAIRHLTDNPVIINRLNNLLGLEGEYEIKDIANAEFLSLLKLVYIKEINKKVCKKCLNTDMKAANGKKICSACGEENGTVR